MENSTIVTMDLPKPKDSVKKGRLMDAFNGTVLGLAIGSLIDAGVNGGGQINDTGKNVFQEYLAAKSRERDKFNKSMNIGEALKIVKAPKELTSLVPLAEHNSSKDGDVCFDPFTGRTKKDCSDPQKSREKKRLRGVGAGSRQKGVKHKGEVPGANVGKRGSRIKL